MDRERRRFLRLAGAASGLALVGSACESSESGGGSADARAAGADARPGDDGGATCEPTRGDAQGPFFEPGAPMRTKIAADDEPGERLVLAGRVVADDCETPIAGVLLDVWQADRDGVYYDAGNEFRLRGQILTDADGRFEVDTIKPGNYTLADGVWRPAHLHFTASKPGLTSVTTQLYFAGDPFLPPNDGCTTCGSDDPDRIIPLSGTADTGWTGDWTIVLASA